MLFPKKYTNLYTVTLFSDFLGTIAVFWYFARFLAGKSSVSENAFSFHGAAEPNEQASKHTRQRHNFFRNSPASCFTFNSAILMTATMKSIAVLPGDNVTFNVTGLGKNIKLGDGLHQVDDAVFSSLAGILRYRAPTTYWVEGDKRMYIPRAGDQVVGIIEEKLGEFYRVNIFSNSSAMLNKLAFEGATKRNKPELKKGDVLYLRVSVADKDLDTEVTCITSSGSKKEWSTGETVC